MFKIFLTLVVVLLLAYAFKLAYEYGVDSMKKTDKKDEEVS